MNELVAFWGALVCSQIWIANTVKSDGWSVTWSALWLLFAFAVLMAAEARK